jgi:hypothetical protein
LKRRFHSPAERSVRNYALAFLDCDNLIRIDGGSFFFSVEPLNHDGSFAGSA